MSRLIGGALGHLDILHSQGRQRESGQEKLSDNWQQTLEKKTADLARANEQLLEENARHRESQQVLRQSEQQYRFLFTENPQPQWIFDLRSLRLLAVNRAALGLFGFSPEEMMALPTSRLLHPDAVPFFRRDVAFPCPKALSRGCWPFCTKEGTCIEAEISAVDLNYDGCPARLIVAAPVIARRRPEPEPTQVNFQTVSEAPKVQSVSETTKLQLVAEPPCKTAPAVDRTPPEEDSQPKVVVSKSPELAPSQEPKKTAPEVGHPVAPTPAPISLPVRSPTPAKPVQSVPRLSDLSRTSTGKHPNVKRPQATPVGPKPPPGRSASGKETILLVEPEGKARSLARFVLDRHGYHVIETDCSSTVLALWDSESTSVDVLLTDLALPEGTSGRALADHLRQTKPELKVVYTSAPTETETEDALMEQNILPKPYTPDKLLEAVQNCVVRGEEVRCAVV